MHCGSSWLTEQIVEEGQDGGGGGDTPSWVSGRVSLSLDVCQLWLRNSEQEQSPQDPGITATLHRCGQEYGGGEGRSSSRIPRCAHLTWEAECAWPRAKGRQGVTSSWSIGQSPASRKFTF